MATVEQIVDRRFREALVRFHMLSDGDKVLVGVSGGKDSLCLLELLARRSRVQRPQFSVHALHVWMENITYETDTTWLQGFCDRLGVPLHIVTTRFDAPREGQKEKPACFLCSWMRRKQLFQVAQQLGCNKIAFGHHQDDLIHTSLMNIFYQGHFSTMPAVLQMRKMPLTIIRPLCLQHETDIVEWAAAHGYEKQRKQCPYEHDTQRTAMRRVFESIEAANAEARYSVWNALEREGKLVEI